MHQYFADWYRIANIDFDVQLLEKRWAVVEKLIKKVDSNSSLEWVRLFLRRPLMDKDFKGQFAESFKRDDPTFPMKKNEIELRVLAGAAIIHLLQEGKTECANTAALSTLCGYCFGLRKPALFKEVITESQSYLAKQAGTLRDSGTLSRILVRRIDNSKLTKSLEQAYASNDQAIINKTSAEAFKFLVEGMSGHSRSIGVMMNALSEESNILWWLMGGYSNDLEKGFPAVDLAVACLVAPKELADLTGMLPGPVAVPAVLDKMLATAKAESRAQVAIKDAINASPRKWREMLVAEANPFVGDLAPLHIGMQKSLETKRKSNWLPSFRTLTQIDPTKKCDPLVLSLQFYRERLLHRAMTTTSESRKR